MTSRSEKLDSSFRWNDGHEDNAGSHAHARDAATADADGLVFAGVGNGNLRGDWLAALSAAARHGVAIVRASCVSNGTTVRNGEIDDDAHGFVSADNLTPLQARVLTMLALARGATARDLQLLFDSY